MQDISNVDIEKLTDFVRHLHKNGARHKNRGFSLHDSNRYLASNHMLEEAVELQSAAQFEDRQAVVEEGGDMLAVFLHLLLHCGVDFNEVVDECYRKLDEVFVLDDEQVKVESPTLSRRGRHKDKS